MSRSIWFFLSPFIFIFSLIFCFPFFATHIKHIELKRWQICPLSNGGGSIDRYAQAKAQISRCNPVQSDLPTNEQSLLGGRFSPGWYFLSAEFISTPEIFDPKGDHRLVFGQAEGFEAYLNGKLVGANPGFPPLYQYGKVYPVSISLPHTLINPVGSLNRLELIFYASGITAKPFVDQGPVGLFTQENALTVSELLTAERVVSPLVAALGLIVLFCFALNLYASQKHETTSLRSFAIYCFISAISLVSFSRVPRRYFDPITAVSFHFIFRFFSDFLYFKMIESVLSKQSRATKFALLIFVSVLIFFSVSIFLETGSESQALIYKLARVALFTTVMIPVYGLFLTKALPNNSVERTPLLIVFTVDMIVSAMDFMGFIGIRPEHYFARFRPFIIALAFGWLIWLRLMQKQLELRTSAKLGKLAEQVAHDIRSPLAALKVIASRFVVLDADDGAILKLAIERISKTTSDLLPRNEVAPASDGEVFFQVSDFKTYFGNLKYEKMTEHKGRSEIQLEFEDSIPPATREKVRGDLSTLCRVLSNLINNAFEATHFGLISVCAKTENTNLVIVITDPGCGMSEALVSRLGQGRVPSSKPEGHGLGLSHAFDVVRGWGGTIQIQSKTGQGTQVTISLPFQ